jgi:hypothetical protein
MTSDHGEIAEAIAAEVDADPAGDVEGAGNPRAHRHRDRATEEIAAIVLRSNPDGSKLTVGDVATLRVEGVDRDRGSISWARSRHLDPGGPLRPGRRDQDPGQVEEVAARCRPPCPRGSPSSFR